MERSIDKLNGKPCEEAVEKMNDPFPSITIVNALLTMTWRIVGLTGPQLFLTSDNPACLYPLRRIRIGRKRLRDRDAHLSVFRVAWVTE